MEMTGKGVISPNDLMAKLVQAKKVMNKVESGNYEKGNINENVIKMDPEEAMKSTMEPKTVQSAAPKQHNVKRIQDSKLPDAIKKAMIENPIPQISLNDSIDMDLVKGANKLMEREGMIKKQPQSNPSNVNLNSNDQKFVVTNINHTYSNGLETSIQCRTL